MHNLLFLLLPLLPLFPPLDASSRVAPMTASTITIPPELREKHGPLVELILGSESMNDEERQYWVNILAVMTPEQVENLRQILTNEKQQLAAIDKKYQKEIGQMGQEELIRKTAEERKRKRDERVQKEQKQENTEDTEAKMLLEQIEQT